MLRLVNRVVALIGPRWLKRLRGWAKDVAGTKRPFYKKWTINWLLPSLLRIMAFMFWFDKKFRDANIREFNAACFAFKIKGDKKDDKKDDKFECYVVFRKPWILWFRRMVVKKKVRSDPHVTVTFKDRVSLYDYILLADDHDPVNLLLENQVKIEGNLNYIYKFMYMVRHLTKPLGIT
jgi:hypothetical protein